MASSCHGWQDVILLRRRLATLLFRIASSFILTKSSPGVRKRREKVVCGMRCTSPMADLQYEPCLKIIVSLDQREIASPRRQQTPFGGNASSSLATNHTVSLACHKNYVTNSFRKPWYPDTSCITGFPWPSWHATSWFGAAGSSPKRLAHRKRQVLPPA